MKSQIHELKNLITKKMSKNLKLITLIAIVILAVSCKKEKQTIKTCYISSIKSGPDSIAFSYNQSNKITNIKHYWYSDIINMDFAKDGTIEKHTVTTSSVGLPGYAINYTLNAKGFIESYERSTVSGGYSYLSMAQNKYDSEDHLISSEMTSLRNGMPYLEWKDSMIYENGNLTEYYNLYFGSIHRKTLITYSTTPNTIGFYSNNDYSITDVVGGSRFYDKKRPYICHLLGKGSKNLPQSAVLEFSTNPSINRTETFNYTFDSEQKITSETISTSISLPAYPKTNTFHYICK